MQELAKQLAELFQGSTDVRGVYDMRKPTTIDGKVKGKPHTEMTGPTEKHWYEHLTTMIGLGVSPIEKKGKIDNKVRWAVIDIDKYDFDYGPTLKAVENTPFVPVRTKSGGLNLFVFFKAWVSAGAARKCLIDISRRIGFGGSEVFPKQSKILIERGDSSSWVNMPYNGGRESERYGLAPDGSRLSIEQFISLANIRRTTLKDLNALEISGTSQKDHEHIPDGPPCLQWLTDNGFPKGSMNRALINLGVYYKRATPDTWEERVEQANKKWMTPGTREEVKQVINSLNKKGYSYTCTEEPMCSHCDSVTCSQRKFGVSATLQLPKITELTKIKTVPPVYFMTVEDNRIGPITSVDLMDSMTIARIIFEVTNKPLMIKRVDWFKFLTDLMTDIDELDSPETRGEYGRLMEQLGEYLVSGHVTEVKTEVVMGRVYADGDKRMFQLSSFINYLTQHGFKYNRNEIVAILKEEKIKSKVLKIKDRQYRVWVMSGVMEPEELEKRKANNGTF